MTSDDFLHIPNDSNFQDESEKKCIGSKFGSTITFSSNQSDENNDRQCKRFEEDDDREGWDNKIQFFMGVISYAVGLGNVWRFPYLCQKNGGGAFLIPYCIMMVIEGTPLFLLELGIGQRLRSGPVGVWNSIHPYLGGVGVCAAVTSFLVGLYYNVIITWCIYYLYKSLSWELPWQECPKINGTPVDECLRSSSITGYFWNREAMDTSGSIGEFDGFVLHMTVSLILAWILIYLCIMHGIKSSGKVMYLTATFPYLVTTVFLIRSAMLDGALEGLKYMLTPDLNRLKDPNVWLDAATQIFYSMGIGFGGLIAFGSYNKIKNNCKRDTVALSVCNLFTSLYTAVVIFCVLGYMGGQNYNKCLEKGMENILTVYPGRYNNLSEIKQEITYNQFASWMHNNFKDSQFPLLSDVSERCDYNQIISKAAEGSGLAFVVFTEAITQFPFPPIWAVLFFLMLLMLGLGTMFGTLEGVITSLNDSKLVKLDKPVITAILCSVACAVGLVFTTHSGQYWVSLFDHFAGSYGLMGVAFFEVLAVIYVYDWRNFAADLEEMCNEKISAYWRITWRFISPVIMFILFASSVVKAFYELPKYVAYDRETVTLGATEYPSWALIIAFTMIAFAMAPVPLVWIVRKFKIIKMEPDIPISQKHRNMTESAAHIMKSDITLNKSSLSSTTNLSIVHPQH